MAVYLVTWDLNKEKPNYTQARKDFLDNLNRHENTRDQGLDSVRFVSTSLSADSLYNDLSTKLDKNDRIVVTKMVSGNHQGLLIKDVWDWINARINL